MTKYSIYIIKNKINNKVYIGATTKDINHRFMRHKSYRNINSTNKLYSDMELLGIDNFYIEELEVTYDLNKARKLEKYYINEYNSINEGYNRVGGGSIISNESIKEKYKHNKGENHPMYGKKQSEKNKKIVGDNFRGTKNINSKGKIEIKNIALDIKEIKNSSRDAERYLRDNGHKISYKKIQQCCNEGISYKGFTFNWMKK